MTDSDVRIVRLPPLRVAAALAYGAEPELEAWGTLLTWAHVHHQLDVTPAPRFFGFNNPDPAPGTPNHGYEQWLTVGPEAAGDGAVTVKDFPGGLYAVLHCPGIPNPEIWARLVAWRESSRYRPAHHQWLEECLTPPGVPPADMVFDLYLPIAE